MKKYKLTNESKTVYGRKLYRIQALRDFSDVREGELGGFVEAECNLSHNGNAWVYENALVSGNARVSGNAQVYENARVYGNAWVFGDARVSGNASVYGNALVFGDAWVYGDARIQKNTDYIQTKLGDFDITATKSNLKVKIGCEHKTIAEWLDVTEAQAEVMGLNLRDYQVHLAFVKLCEFRFKQLNEGGN